MRNRGRKDKQEARDFENMFFSNIDTSFSLVMLENDAKGYAVFAYTSKYCTATDSI